MGVIVRYGGRAQKVSETGGLHGWPVTVALGNKAPAQMRARNVATAENAKARPTSVERALLDPIGDGAKPRHRRSDQYLRMIGAGAAATGVGEYSGTIRRPEISVLSKLVVATVRAT